MTLKKSFTKTTNFMMMMMFAIYWTLHTRVGARALSLKTAQLNPFRVTLIL